MNPGVYAALDKVEAEHWWYRGLRDATDRWLAHAEPPLPAGPRVLDAGCGTGGNLRHLWEVLAPSYLGGFDVSDSALDLARGKVPEADLYRSDLCAPVFHTDGFDLVTSYDVLYIPGVARARAGLFQLVDRLAPGGRLVLNLPAYAWLAGEHDLAIHAHERYTVARVGGLLRELGLTVERLSYRVCLLFPAVVASRLPGLLRRNLTAERARSAIERPSGVRLNGPLLATLRLENALIARGAALPWGSSVFAVGRKPGR